MPKNGKESDAKKWKKDIPWKCSNCDLMLGVLSVDGLELRIKWRDLYVTIKESRQIDVKCRRCGRDNTVTGTIPEKKLIMSPESSQENEVAVGE